MARSRGLFGDGVSTGLYRQTQENTEEGDACGYRCVTEFSKNGLAFHLRFWGPGDHLCGPKHSRQCPATAPDLVPHFLPWRVAAMPGFISCSEVVQEPDKQAVDRKPGQVLSPQAQDWGLWPLLERG